MCEELMVRHGSPTLAGLKTGSLFTCPFGEEQVMQDCVRCWMLASGDRDHILSGVFNQFLSEKSEPAE